MIRTAMIAAVAENGIIGDNGRLPWSIKSELQHFKMTTLNKPVIMGRKTFESLGKPLKDRTNIVVTRDAAYKPAGVTVVNSIDAALDIAKKTAEDDEQDEIVIIGGAEIYKQGIEHADRMYITRVHINPHGDAKFPEFNKGDWYEVKSEFHQAAEGETSDYTIKVYDKRI